MYRANRSFNTEQPTYNPAAPDGGDPTKIDVNGQYFGYEANYVYIAACCFIVWLILPGVGLFYAGLARRKSALNLLFMAFAVNAVYVVWRTIGRGTCESS